MTDYIVEYENLYCSIVEHDEKLLDNGQTCKLLDGANLLQDHCNLVIVSTNDIKFETVHFTNNQFHSESTERR